MGIQKKIQAEKQDESRSDRLSHLTFMVCFIVAVGLMIGGFFTPPQGAIDGSVLTGIGELVLFPTVRYAYIAIKLGLRVKFQKGETSIEISKDDDN